MNNNKLFVGSLPYATTSEQLQQLFSQVGTVVSANVIMDRYTGQGKGFGFVEMSTPEEAQAAIAKLDGFDYEGRKIVVNIAKPQENRGPGGGNRGGGGGFGRDDRRGGGGGGRDNRSRRW